MSSRISIGRLRPHFLFWSLYVLFQVLLDWVNPSIVSDSLDIFLIHLLHILNFYTIVFCIETSFSIGWPRKILLFAISLALFITIFWFYCSEFIQWLGHGKYYKGLLFESYFWWGLDYYVTYFFYAMGYSYVKRSGYAEQKLNQAWNEKLSLENKNLELKTDNLELQSQNLKLQNQKLKAEYDFLKAQINPHFLYNTLSFFYSKTAATDMETAEGIALLTDIMRYSLQQGEADGKVGLEDEVAHLNSYIRLQQMRFNNTLNIEFENDIETEKYRIVPHVFITLVENAFKHGEVNNPMHPLKISLKEADGKIIFLVKNKIQHNPVINPGTGVGLNNIRNRVKMEYGDAASLENNITDDFFSISFSVPIVLLEIKTDGHPDNNDALPVSLINKKIAL